MYQITDGMISNLKLAWEDIIHVEPEIEGIETNPAINQTLAPNEPVALVTFSVEMGKSTTFINLGIPYISIEKLIDKLVVQYWFKNDETEDKEETRQKMEHVLKPVEVNIAAELGRASLTVDDFLKLSSGDIIKLDTNSASPIKVLIENEEYYYAKPGLVGKNMGISILDIINKDVNDYE